MLPSQTKVADFEHTVGIDKEVSGLDVPMHDFGWMKVFDTPQYLVEENFDVVRGQMLGRDDDFM